MKCAIAMLSMLTLLPAAAWAGERVDFSGSIWENGGVSLSFDESIAPGQQRTMTLSGGRTVEMSVDEAGQSTIRLLDRAGSALHSEVTPAGGGGVRKFMYAFCRGGRVAFTSPPEAGRSGCR